MARVVTNVLELVALGLVVAGAVAVVVGVSAWSVPLAWVVAGVEGVGLGFGGLWISERVSR